MSFKNHFLVILQKFRCCHIFGMIKCFSVKQLIIICIRCAAYIYESASICVVVIGMLYTQKNKEQRRHFEQTAHQL